MQTRTFQAQILTPNGPLFEGEAAGVVVPGSEGSFEMLYNHAPIVSALGIGKVRIRKADKSELIFAVSGGFVEMSNNSMTLLAEEASAPDQIDVEEARRLRDEAREQLKSALKDREKLEKQLARAENLIRIAG